jgi:hypothetical protein
MCQNLRSPIPHFYCIFIVVFSFFLFTLFIFFMVQFFIVSPFFYFVILLLFIFILFFTFIFSLFFDSLCFISNLSNFQLVLILSSVGPIQNLPSMGSLP